MSYLSPGVYVEQVKSPSTPTLGTSDSVGGFVGTLPSGPLVPTKVTSWNDYLNKFAFGLTSPFSAEHDTPYSVYGFFQNGGQSCYITRVLPESATYAKASITVGEEVFELPVKYKGAEGNKITVTVVKNEDLSTEDEELFNVSVLYDGSQVEYYEALSNDTESSKYWVDVVANGNVLAPTEGTLLAQEKIVFSGGSDNLTEIVDNDYKKAIDLYDSVEDVNMFCVPGQTSLAMAKISIDYTEARKNKDIFVILDAPKNSTVESVKEFRKSISCENGALYYPWGRVTDPLSKTGKLRDCPTCGHVMGVYARIIESRGVWKAPAGTEAVVKGFIEMVTSVKQTDMDVLNPMAINSVVAKPNYGIVVWGARSLSTDDSFRYVSDILLDTFVRKSIFEGTQEFVFEPNDSTTWGRVTTAVTTFLEGLYQKGAFPGASSKEAYFVQCDGDLNNEAMRNAGKLMCKCGYAQNKPAEFVIFTVSHSVTV